MLSKQVSREQAIRFNSRVLVGDQINQIVNTCFFDPQNVQAMSRAFAGKHQVALAILYHNGDNNYLRDKGGLSFGIRRSFVKDPDGKGIILFDHLPRTEDETTIGMMTKKYGLRYKIPNVMEGGFANGIELFEEMKNILHKDFVRCGVFDQMSNEERDFWEQKLKCKDGFVRVYDIQEEVNTDEEEDDDSICDYDNYEDGIDDEDDVYPNDTQPIVFEEANYVPNVDSDGNIPVYMM